jgi:hypothetical protein
VTIEQVGAEGERARVLLGEAALQALRGESANALEIWRDAESFRQRLGVQWGIEERVVIQRLLEPLGSAAPSE